MPTNGRARVGAVGYIRVSSQEQARGGVSLDAQRAGIEAWGVANRAEMIAVHIDAGLSGGRADNRPGLQSALADACKRRVPLIVYSLSRLARSTKDAISISERLAKAGADLVSLSEKIDTTTAAGKMIFRLLAVLAEFERDLIAERTATAMRHKRLRGEYTGGEVPYGWRLLEDGATLAPSPKEQAVISTARDLRRSGLSLRSVGEGLHRKGFHPRCGARWHAKTVQALLAAKTPPARASEGLEQ